MTNILLLHIEETLPTIYNLIEWLKIFTSWFPFLGCSPILQILSSWKCITTSLSSFHTVFCSYISYPIPLNLWMFLFPSLTVLYRYFSLNLTKIVCITVTFDSFLNWSLNYFHLLCKHTLFICSKTIQLGLLLNSSLQN